MTEPSRNCIPVLFRGQQTRNTESKSATLIPRQQLSQVSTVWFQVLAVSACNKLLLPHQDKGANPHPLPWRVVERMACLWEGPAHTDHSTSTTPLVPPQWTAHTWWLLMTSHLFWEENSTLDKLKEDGQCGSWAMVEGDWLNEAGDARHAGFRSPRNGHRFDS